MIWVIVGAEKALLAGYTGEWEEALLGRFVQRASSRFSEHRRCSWMATGLLSARSSGALPITASRGLRVGQALGVGFTRKAEITPTES